MKKITFLFLLLTLVSCASHTKSVKQQIEKPNRVILDIANNDEWNEKWRAEFEKHYDEVIMADEVKTYSQVTKKETTYNKSTANVLHESEKNLNVVFKLSYTMGWDLYHGARRYSFRVIDLTSQRSIANYLMTNPMDGVTTISGSVDDIQKFLDKEVWKK